jgi:hypothetical protein
MPEVTKNFSRIIGTDGVTYIVKDAVAREAIAALQGNVPVRAVSAATTPYGVVWNDGSSDITGTLVASESTLGKMYLVPNNHGARNVFDEYMTFPTGTNSYVWELIGDTEVHLSDLGALAYQNGATGTFTPEGAVSQPSFTGNSMTATGDFTPSGTVSQPSFTGTSGNLSVSGTPAGTIGIGSGSANYTPAGSVSAPTIDVTPSTETQYVAGSTSGGGSVTAGSAASCTLPTVSTTYDDNTETLSLSFTPGTFTPNVPTSVTMPTFTAKTNVTGITSASASAPAFTGTGVELTFSGNSLTSTGTFTPEGTISQPSFTGTESEVSVTGTPSGTVSKPTFTGTSGTVSVS